MSRKGRGWHGESARHSAAARGAVVQRLTPEEIYQRYQLAFPRSRKSRFNEFGDATDGSGRHVTEFENADLSNDELVQKYNAFREAHDIEMLRIVGRELEERGVFGQPND